MTRGRLRAIVPPLLLWWLSVTAVAIAIAWACRIVSDAGLDWAGIDVHRVLPLVAVYLAVATIGGLPVRRHPARRPPVPRDAHVCRAARPGHPASAVDPAEEAERARPSRRPAVAVALVVAVGALAAAAPRSQLDLAQDVAITAHRGAKIATPENTLAAFRAAIDAGATYTELDVQRTRDGRIVVVHDGDLMRMGGDPRKVSDLTAARSRPSTSGASTTPTFTGEFPPTLEEVIDLVRGRMRINVELKYNVPDPALAPAVIDLLRAQDFLDQVVITSLDYAALKQVESLEPRLATGQLNSGSTPIRFCTWWPTSWAIT